MSPSSIQHDDVSIDLDEDLLGDSQPDETNGMNGNHYEPSQPLRVPPDVPLDAGARLVIALDYGTTYTGLAYATTLSETADMKSIKVVQRWTSQKMDNKRKVPSVISYVKGTQGEAQWGSDISGNAITMANTKLELEPQDTRFDELDLTLQALKGTHNLSFDHVSKAGPDPAYTTRPPQQIIEDYLTKIVECSRRELNTEQFVRTGTAVDVIVTVPANWSYTAHDAMFKAVRGAGFDKTTFPTLQDTILVSEPETASYFTALDLQNRGTDFLQEGHCFILCDAGGGTVDVVSYQVNKVKPLLLEKATEPNGGKCGSTLIDTAFKNWLRDIIGKDRYKQIDPANASQYKISAHCTESGAMRELIQQFNVHKHSFSRESQSDIKIDLPEALKNLSIEGRVTEGELTLHWDEMKTLMDGCVNGVLKLIKGQVQKVSDEKGRRVKNVFLVGGFGASPYLQDELRKSLARRKPKMELRRPDPDKSLTAVVQGGVIYGIEKARHKDARYMAAITKDYGILRERDQFQWLIRKGDLLLSNSATIKTSKPFWYPIRGLTQGKVEFPIYTYKNEDEDDDPPESYKNGKDEVEPVGAIKCDFSNYLDHGMKQHPNTLVPGQALQMPAVSKTNIGPLQWRLKIFDRHIEAEILLNETPHARCQFPVEADWSADRRRESLDDNYVSD